MWQKTLKLYMDKDIIYKQHILEAITRVAEYLEGVEYNQFLKNKLLQAGLVRELEIIGEAAKHFSQEYRSSLSGIPWKDIVGMRDKLIHDYFSVSLDDVWNTAQNDLPVLKNALKA